MNRGWLRTGAARYWPIGAAVLVVAVAGGVVVATARDEKLRAAVGDVVTTDIALEGNDPALATSTIRLPDGAYEVGVSRSPVAGSDAFTDREAPDDGSWVALKVAATVSDYYNLPSTAARADTEQPDIDVELVADGRRYPVPRDPTRNVYLRTASPGRQAWIAVAGRPTALAVAISYNGVRQTVFPAGGRRDTGRAAPLYAPAFAAAQRSTQADPPSCGTATYPTGFGSTDSRYPLRCGVDRYPPLPYLPQLGWAPAGSSWLVLSVRPQSFATFRWRGARGTTAFYGSYRDPEVSVAVDGTQAVTDADEAPTIVTTSSGSRLAAFRVPSTIASRHRLSVTATWADLDTANPGRPAGAPASPDVTVTWTGELR